MITQAILTALTAPFYALVQMFPQIRLEIPPVVWSPLISLVDSLGYVVPVKALLPILSMSMVFYTVKTAWALVIRLKSFIPTMGS